MINTPVNSTVDSTGATLVPTVSPFGEVSTINDVNRRIQEIMLLIQQSQLLSVQLSNDKTGRYNFIEVR